MKLDPELVEYLKKVLKTAQVLKFDNIVIEKEVVRGWNEDRTAVIADTNVPELPFNGIGIGGVGKLLNRMGLVDNFTADYEMVNNFVMSLELKAKGMSVKYRCANPNAIKTPRKLKDSNRMWSFEMCPETIAQLTKAQAAMGAEMINIKSDDGVCTAILTDPNRDTYMQAFNGYVDNVSGMEDAMSFDFHYNMATFLTILKHADKQKNIEGPEGSLKLTIGQGGTLESCLNSINVSVAPQSIL